MEKATDLPEIIANIAKYLNRNSLAIACRVNRRWLASLHPQLWSDLKLDCSASSNRRPSAEQIQKHLQLVRHLELSAMPSNEFSLFEGAHHLRTLVYDNLWEQFQIADPSNSQNISGPWSTLSDLVIHSGATLKDLSILTRQLEPRVERDLDSPTADLTGPTPFWRSAADHCPGIERLVLRYVTIHEEDAPAFWTLCSRQLKRLHLGKVRLPSLAPIQATLDDISDVETEDLLERQYPKMDKVKELTFYGVQRLSPRRQVQLWQRCPNLETLVWDDTHRKDRVKFAAEAFAEALAESSWPYLDNVSIFCEWLNSNQVAAILNATRVLRFLRLSPVQFASDAFQALNQLHFAERMEHLVLTSPDALDHFQTLTVLETFKALKKFRGGRLCLNLINLNDRIVALRDHPWACRQLERLSIDICEEIPTNEDPQVHSSPNEENGAHPSSVAGSTLTQSIPIKELCPESRTQIQKILLQQLANLRQLQEVELHSIRDWERAPRRRRTSLLRPDVLPYRRPSPLLLCFNGSAGGGGTSDVPQSHPIQAEVPKRAASQIEGALLSPLSSGGVASLKNWQRLRILRFQGQQDLGEAEIQWMKDNWPQIWIVEGPLHSSRARHEELVEYMEARGILRS
ncbi:hypothetical protein EMPS_03009 [Entomortierella parvispora]|uniref:F-box domain-containing protein n=1 Tax=Entomortierella parvispora TaxID=205924 RepID=A0A9P3LU83_9FUNG|nr:hypothetical protein EMPS_03009 [Entomortierella parvispora]